MAEISTQPAREKNVPRVLNAWALFDWANSAYALVITAAIFPAYYSEVTNDTIRLFGTEFTNSSLYAYSISLAYVLIAIITPPLSGIADYTQKKKTFLKFFTTLGALACISLFFFRGMDELWLGISAFMLSTIGFAGGLVFYNAYLPDIATEDKYDRISARGYAFGYVGSVILLLFNLFVIQRPDFFGLPSGDLPVRLSFLTVGIWWLGFAQITFRYLPDDEKGKIPRKIMMNGYREIQKVWFMVRKESNIMRFLFSFFLYSAGVQTVLYLAATFGEKVLEFGTEELIVLILILQLVAVGGAYLFAFISEKLGNKLSLMTMLIIWTLICILAYFVTEKIQFYFVAASVGLVMGGIQSLSRSTYSKLLPINTRDLASFFSFFEVLKIISIVIGTFLFGFVDQITGGMRNSVLVLGIFFILGLIVLSTVKIKHAKRMILVE